MILLLDSEPVVRSVLKDILETAGYVVLATGSLGVAVDELARCKIDLVITHPYVNSIPGHEAAKYLRTRCPQRLPVLFVAGLWMMTDCNTVRASKGLRFFRRHLLLPN
jgi:CheY-like chemotaxis protein